MAAAALLAAALPERQCQLRRKARAEMKLRIGFSVALIAVVFGVWLMLSKPSCEIGFKAALVSLTSWTCVGP